MSKHKSEDYKITAVKYYFNDNNYTKTRHQEQRNSQFGIINSSILN